MQAAEQAQQALEPGARELGELRAPQRQRVGVGRAEGRRESPGHERVEDGAGVAPVEGRARRADHGPGVLPGRVVDPRGRGGEGQRGDPLGTRGGQQQRDEAAERRAQHVHAPQAEVVEQRDHVGDVALDTRGRRPRRQQLTAQVAGHEGVTGQERRDRVPGRVRHQPAVEQQQRLAPSAQAVRQQAHVAPSSWFSKRRNSSLTTLP